MWPWSSSSDKPAGSSTSQNESSKPPHPQSVAKDVKKAAVEFDPSKLPDKQKLNPKLQKIMDKEDHEENFFDELVDG
jgi:fission process protein 1